MDTNKYEEVFKRFINLVNLINSINYRQPKILQYVSLVAYK